MLWGLILAMPICGISGVVAQWLGAQHFHRVFAGVSAVPQEHPHSHFGLLRHHHQHADPSVVVVGIDAEAAASELVPAAASLMPLVTLTAPTLLLLQMGLRHARPHTALSLLPGRETVPLDRPPDRVVARSPNN